MMITTDKIRKESIYRCEWLMRGAAMSLGAILTVVCASCEKELDFKYHDIPPLTVIEAELTPAGLRTSVRLTVPMDEPLSDARNLTDATVTVTDLVSGEISCATSGDEGEYESGVAGIPGHSYRLEVEREGKVYKGETEMYPPTEIIGLEFNWIRMPYDDVAVLQCRYADDPQKEGECYWVKVYRNGEIYMWSEQSDRTAEDGIMTYFAMTSRRDLDEEDEQTALRDGDEISVTVSRISRRMHDYLEALSNDSNGPEMFDMEEARGTAAGSPGSVAGLLCGKASSSQSSPVSRAAQNTAQRCLGYFIATSPVTATIIFHPDEIPYASPK